MNKLKLSLDIDEISALIDYQKLMCDNLEYHLKRKNLKEEEKICLKKRLKKRTKKLNEYCSRLEEVWPK